ncbi:MAG: hypothetical protein EA378_04775 [Phycisphaerales bacterium]|nr:MAG: hypothetical protein EA378_04775 [Phycisphaerales bacterium]
MAALLLSDDAVTLRPSPAEGGASFADVQRAVGAVPRFYAFMQSWQWSMPLWRTGVLAAASGGEDAASDVGDVCEAIAAQDRLSPLRPLMRRDWLDDRARYLDAVAGDLLRGGPDPAVSVPLAAAIDRFSARHGLVVVRSAPTSVAQKAEARLATRLLAFSVPVLDQAEGDRLLEARRELAPELGALRGTLSELVRLVQVGATGTDAGVRALEADVARAAREYASAFVAVSGELTRIDDPDDARVTQAMVSVTLVRLPTDAVLRSSAAAARAYLGTGAPVRGSGAGAATLPVHAPKAGSVVAAMVKTIGRPSPRA